MKYKRIASALLLLWLWLVEAASAQTLGATQDFIDAFASATGAKQWADAGGGADVLRDFEDAEVYLCARDGEVICASAALPLSEASGEDDAARVQLALLEAAGAPDAAALTEEIVRGDSAREISVERDGLRAGVVRGKGRSTVYVCDADEFANLVWLPLLSGKKRHSNPSCSGMDGPRLATASASEAAGFDRCKKCKWN